MGSTPIPGTMLVRRLVLKLALAMALCGLACAVEPVNEGPAPTLLVCPGGGGSQIGKAIAFAPDGALYFAGIFDQELELVDGDRRPTRGANDIFVMKLTPQRRVSWIRTFGGVEDDEVNALHAASGGGIYLAGSYRRTVDFDPGPGEAVRSAGGVAPEAFLLQLSPDGAFVRAEVITGASGDYESRVDSIAVDAAGATWLAGRFRGTIALPEPDGMAIAHQGAAYVARLDAAGKLDWARVIDGEGDDSATVAAAADGRVWVAGSFSQTLSLRLPGVPALSSAGPTSGYVLELAPALDRAAVAAFGGPGVTVTVHASAATHQGGLLVAGQELSARGTTAFLARFAPGGAAVWKSAESGGADAYLAVGASDDDGAFVAGTAASRDPSAGRVFLASFRADGHSRWSRWETAEDALGLDSSSGELAIVGSYTKATGGLHLTSSNLWCGRLPFTPAEGLLHKAFLVSYR
jgi:hypothetical protein